MSTPKSEDSPLLPPQDDDVFPPTEQNSLYSVVTVGGTPKSRRLKSATPPKIPDELLVAGMSAVKAPPLKEENTHTKGRAVALEHVPTIPGADEPKSLGNILKRARVHKGWSIQDVSGFIKIAPRQIDALERNDFSSLPMRTFVRGFVRNYARLLGLDPHEMIGLLPENIAISTEDDAELHTLIDRRGTVRARDPNHQTPKRSNMLLWILICVVLVFLIAFVALHPAVQQWARVNIKETAGIASQEAPTQEPFPPSGLINDPVVPIQPIPPQQPGMGVTAQAEVIDPNAAIPTPQMPPVATPAPQPALPAGAAELVIQVAGGESWLEVYDGNETPLLMVLAPDGYKRIFNAVPPYSVKMGKSENVFLSYRGAAVDSSTYQRRRDGVSVAILPAANR